MSWPFTTGPAPLSRGLRIGGHGADDVGVRLSAVGDEGLLPVDAHARLDLSHAGLREPEGGAGSRLGQRQRGEVLPRTVASRNCLCSRSVGLLARPATRFLGFLRRAGPFD